MKNFLIALSLLVGPLIPAAAIDFKVHEQYGAERQYAARTSSVSTHTVTGYGLSYSLEAVGGTADFIVSHSTCMGDNAVNSSSTTYLLASEPFSNRFEGLVINPSILITRIDAATTVYVDIQYLFPRGGGAQ